MHYLSHYYYELPNNRPYFVTGLIIPDLAGNFSKSYNSVIKNCVTPNEQNLAAIHQGILHHYEADRRFHNSSLFLQHIATATQSFVKQGLSRERLRLSVIAHVAVEIMIDRQILLEKEQICHDYYHALNGADENVLAAYFKKLSLEEEGKSFFSKFGFFRQRRFLFLLNEVENVVSVLNRIYSSVTAIEFSEEEKGKFMLALNNIDSEIRYSWQEILKV